MCRSSVLVLDVFEYSMLGFGINAPDSALDALAALPGVLGIVPVQREIYGVPDASASNNTGDSDRLRRLTTYNLAPLDNWLPDRMDQKNEPRNKKYTYTMDGTNVRVYILSSGIRYNHADFASSRAVKGYDMVSPGGDASDCLGYGTFVSDAYCSRVFFEHVVILAWGPSNVKAPSPHTAPARHTQVGRSHAAWRNE